MRRVSLFAKTGREKVNCEESYVKMTPAFLALLFPLFFVAFFSRLIFPAVILLLFLAIVLVAVVACIVIILLMHVGAF